MEIKNKKENLFLQELSNLFFFWFIGVLLFSFFRMSFIFIFRDDIKINLNFEQYFAGFFMGFRFDITVISYFLIIPFLSTYILIPLGGNEIVTKIRKIFQILFSILSVLISVITITYYKEYNDQFNHFLFMALYDDKVAVLKSIIADYNPLENILIILLLIFLLIKVFSFFEQKKKIFNTIEKIRNKNKNIFLGIFGFVLFIGSIRGSYTEYPVRRFYSSVTPDDFINKTIINPFRSLNNAISDYNEINSIHLENPFGEIPKTIANNFNTISNSLEKENFRLKNKKIPKQIFLIVMESYDSWPLQKEFKDLGVSSQLQSIQERGVSFYNFLPAASSTMNSLAAIISGVPYCGINISKIGAQKTFTSSIFNQFKSLGYETNFFFAGYPSWENIGNFVKKQGADNVYNGTSSNASKGVWGINDEALLENVISKVDTLKKSINIILTSSYHSPFEVDVYAKGFPYKTKEDLPKKYQKIFNPKKMPLKVLGHLWYSDKAIGAFVKNAEKKYTNSLFAFTGDHFGRRFINGTPTLYQKSSVPFILYGNDIEKINIQTDTIAGSHIDITPTLLNIVAPSSFKYLSFGSSMFLKNNITNIGITHNKTITPNILEHYTKNFGTKNQIINSNNRDNNLSKQKHDSIMSLAWYITVKNDSLPNF